MKKTISRRKFVYTTGGISLGVGLVGLGACSGGGSTEEQETTSEEVKEMFFKISLAEWSLHNAMEAGEYTNLDFPRLAKTEFGIDAIEYVSRFFDGNAENQEYLSNLKSICEDNNVTSLLIMVDDEGNLGDSDESARITAVENHYKWVEAAKFLGCHSIRVNAAGTGTYEEVAGNAVDGLGRLSTYAADFDINVIVENHGGLSSNGEWLSGVLSQVNMANCGSLPDFGNFCIKGSPYPIENCEEAYDRYKGVEELMPFAKGVSAKSNEFDANGFEINMDYRRLLQIVKNAGYTGHVGIEYEGPNDSEFEGIKKTKALLEKVGGEIS